jgi:hypothetical protein
MKSKSRKKSKSKIKITIRKEVGIRRCQFLQILRNPACYRLATNGRSFGGTSASRDDTSPGKPQRFSNAELTHRPIIRGCNRKMDEMKGLIFHLFHTRIRRTVRIAKTVGTRFKAAARSLRKRWRPQRIPTRPEMMPITETGTTTIAAKKQVLIANVSSWEFRRESNKTNAAANATPSQPISAQ